MAQTHPKNALAQVPDDRSQPLDLVPPMILQEPSTHVPDQRENAYRPALVSEANLLGQMLGSGFADQMWLIQLDGRFIQVTELLYRVAEQCNGERTFGEIAYAVSNSPERQVSGQDVEYLISKKLEPIGIIKPIEAVPGAENGQPRTAPSLLRLGLRRGVISANAIEPVASRLQWLFAPVVLVPLVTAALAAYAWLYFLHGVDGLFTSVLYTPGLLFLVFAMQILPGFWHEFGHASALRYGGGRARSIGVGIYVMDPAFYTDVTDSYRLSRAARIRTGFGGMYFDMLLSLALLGLYGITGLEVILVLVVLNSINMVYQFMPLVRLDGYWILADLTGVPDFYSMMGAFVRSVLPVRFWKGPKLPPLRPWVKAAFALYTLIAFPSMLVFMFILIRRIPGILETVRGATHAQFDGIPTAWNAGEWITVGAHISQLAILTVTMIGFSWFLYILARTYGMLLLQLARYAVRRTRPTVQMNRA